MPTEDESIEVLAGLDERDFYNVVSRASSKRNETQEVGRTPPPLNTGRDQFAHWMTRRHLVSDFALEFVVYLPCGAPDREIRLLEVNSLIHLEEADPVQPLDFSPDIDGADFQVSVADITPAQWDAIKGNRLALPPGWQLADQVIVGRKAVG